VDNYAIRFGLRRISYLIHDDATPSLPILFRKHWAQAMVFQDEAISAIGMMADHKLLCWHSDQGVTGSRVVMAGRQRPMLSLSISVL
jgi:hypothetical protein